MRAAAAACAPERVAAGAETHRGFVAGSAKRRRARYAAEASMFDVTVAEAFHATLNAISNAEAGHD